MTAEEKTKLKCLTAYFLNAIGRGYGRKLTTKPLSTSNALKAMMKDGVAEKDIRAAIDWLAGPNQERECRYEVLSGGSLREKWDRICVAMGKPKGGKRKTKQIATSDGGFMEG